uniref:ATP-binding protein n=1 Tax=uncultured Draconibacterium sp. TaxID=1573823 RepID=UPI003217997E
MRTLSEHILDIVQNSIKAKATLIEIIVEEDKKNDLCLLTIKDNGCGMNSEMLKQAANPFFTSRNTRKVGLGLALLKQNAERSNGSFMLESEPGVGTKVIAGFQLSNVDRPPMGDIWETYYLTLLSYSQGVLYYSHKTAKGEFSINSGEIKEMLGDISFQQKEIREGIIEIIKNNLEEIEATR